MTIAVNNLGAYAITCASAGKESRYGVSDKCMTPQFRLTEPAIHYIEQIADYMAKKFGLTQSDGGCQPLIVQRRRATTITGLFIRKQTIVALPVVVKPSTLVASAFQAKCSDHLCCRGLNRGVFSPIKGSIASVASALNSLQERQAKQRFSKVVSPAFERG